VSPCDRDSLRQRSHWTFNTGLSTPDANLETPCDSVLTGLSTPDSKWLLFLSPVPHRKPLKVVLALELHPNLFQLNPLLLCANTGVSQHLCMCVSFSQTFLSRIQVSTLLDPNAYAQDMDLVALALRDDRDLPS